MEEVVESFTRERTQVLHFARQSQSLTLAGSSPKRKLDHLDAEDASPSNHSSPEPKRLRSSTRLSKTKCVELTSEIARQETAVPELSDSPWREPEPEPGMLPAFFFQLV